MSTNLPLNPNGMPPAAGPRHPAPEDLVLYAMQLLSAEESAPLAEHLASCAECRAELARIHSDLAVVAATVELEAAPAGGRARLMQQVAREKKIVPMPQPAAQAIPQAAPIAAFGRTSSILSIEEKPKRHTGRVVLGVAGWAIAAALAVGVVFQYKNSQATRSQLVAQAGEIDRLNADAAQSHALMDALTDPKAQRVTLSLTAKPVEKAQPIGGVTYNPQKGSLVFLASNLDPLQTYKTYELWVIPADGTAPIPAGTFHPDDQGNASVIMPDLPKGVAAKAFGVTIEPDGGSQTPTAPIILAGS